MLEKKEKLDICFISQEYPPYSNWGGIASYYYDLANIFVKMGHHVTVISRAENNAPKFEKLKTGIEIWRLGKTLFRRKFVGRTEDKILHSKVIYKKLKVLDEKKHFDVFETPEAGLEGHAFIRDPSYSYRTIIQCHGGNGLCIIPKGLFSFFHKKDIYWSLKKELEILHLAKKISVSSLASLQYVKKKKIDSSKIVVIPQGIDTEQFKPANGKDQSPFLNVGFVGRLERPKGIDFIWKIMDQITPEDKIKFHFKGSIHWSSKAEVDKKIKAHSEIAVYHKNSSYTEMGNFYQLLDVLLLPSRFETFGRVYIEAMACGLLVFAGKNGGGSEIISNEKTGFLIDPDSPTDVEMVVHKLKSLSSNRKQYDKIKHNARLKVLEQFKLETFAGNKLKSYWSLINTYNPK